MAMPTRNVATTTSATTITIGAAAAAAPAPAWAAATTTSMTTPPVACAHSLLALLGYCDCRCAAPKLLTIAFGGASGEALGRTLYFPSQRPAVSIKKSTPVPRTVLLDSGVGDPSWLGGEGLLWFATMTATTTLNVVALFPERTLSLSTCTRTLTHAAGAFSFYSLGGQRSADKEDPRTSFLTDSAGNLLSFPVSPS